jgi:4-carboxymuconolactone decarboxylase
LDAETTALVRLAAVLAGGGEAQVDAALRAVGSAEASARVRAEWVEELLLQTYLFAGFPRALNGMRAWRLLTGRPAPAEDAAARPAAAWAGDGARTCGAVYGERYGRLRDHVRALHPALDGWMLEEGYGKVLSRPALDLPRRELCIVAACAATGQWRQLRAHLRGALNVGVDSGVVAEVLHAVAPQLSVADAQVMHDAWRQVLGG